ncbi:UDP binding domain-containing protein [Enterococcus sp. 7D2_DIV0200]|uniref:UDP binding domain-containing protein n=1 Tax=Enterococcus sp. 7D2_DIV0200 TaxID=1834187 RepID=UPI0034E8972C
MYKRQISYKADIGDIRESPTLNIFEILKEKQADISLIDPHVNHFKDKKGNLVNVISNNKCNFQEYDCVVILTKHSSIEYKAVSYTHLDVYKRQ